MRLRSHIAVAALALAFSAPLAAQQQPTGEKPAAIGAIPGVIAKGAKWQRVWQGPMTADGMGVAPDGSLLFAQEQSNSIQKLTPDGRTWVVWPYVEGAGAVSVDSSGRVFAVGRGCTDPGLHLAACADPTPVLQLEATTRKVLADKFPDGKPLGRLNDVKADGRGGAFFTQTGVYHVAADGTVSTVAEGGGMFTNGLVLSPDGKTLYVTNRNTIVAFDVGPAGETSNRRDFATLPGEPKGFGADGMAVDSAGRLYATGPAGIYVFDAAGKSLGIIPVPRAPITLAFAGADRKTLYVGAMGATDPAGKEWATPQGVRNVAMSIYKVPMLASGPK